MLNELFDAARSLRKAGITARRSDNRLVPFPRRHHFIVCLNSDATVCTIRYADVDLLARLRKFETSKGGMRESTPGFNVPSLLALRGLNDEPSKTEEAGFRKRVTDLKKTLKRGALQDRAARQRAVDQLIALCVPNWDKKRAAIEKCIHTAPEVLLRLLPPHAAGEPPELAALREVLARSLLLRIESLHAALLAAARSLLLDATSSLPPDSLLDFLFLEDCGILLELVDYDRYAYPVNSEWVVDWLNDYLLSGQRNNRALGEGKGVFGEEAVVDDEKMPQVKLPRLGAVILRSMSGDVACQHRYGLVEAASCPVGKTERIELAAALEWLCKPEREFSTWADVSRSCGFHFPAILIAYPASVPSEPPQLSALFAGTGRTSDESESTFEHCASAVAERLRGLAQLDPRASISVFALAKADKARTKLLCNREFTAAQIIAGTTEWQTACDNIPVIRFLQFKANSRGVEFKRCFKPFPAELVWCLNTEWQSSGAHAAEAPDMDLGDAITLLIDTGGEGRACAARALYHAVRKSTPLLLSLAQANHARRVHNTGAKYAIQALLIPTILGLLLAKMGNMKGAYMSDSPYLIGRLLSLADQLHRLYCLNVRGNDTPPQLVGNSLMQTALESPLAGLARLSERLPLYYGWAETVKEGKQIGLAKWLLGELGRVEGRIDKHSIARTCGDAEKAQMLLGYLAWNEAEQVEGDSTTPTGESEL